MEATRLGELGPGRAWLGWTAIDGIGGEEGPPGGKCRGLGGKQVRR